MAQRFLLSAAARTLKLRDIYRMSDEAAFEAFKAIRFAENGGEAFCPACGCVETYAITTRRKWKCAGCHKQFSVTSGTIFASRKMAFVDLLAATNAVRSCDDRPADNPSTSACAPVERPRRGSTGAPLSGAVARNGSDRFPGIRPFPSRPRKRGRLPQDGGAPLIPPR